MFIFSLLNVLIQLANLSRKLTCFFVNTQMSDDLVKQLSSYKAQLQQVEVALSTDPENEDLLKLQKDLQVCVCVKKMHESVGFAQRLRSVFVIDGFIWRQRNALIIINYSYYTQSLN